MKAIFISAQKAVAVIKKDTHFDKTNPLSVTMRPIFWDILQKNKEVILTTGAKLCVDDSNKKKVYFLFSYADGETDVKRYVNEKDMKRSEALKQFAAFEKTGWGLTELEPRDYTDKDWENGHL